MEGHHLRDRTVPELTCYAHQMGRVIYCGGLVTLGQSLAGKDHAIARFVGVASASLRSPGPRGLHRCVERWGASSPESLRIIESFIIIRDTHILDTIRASF